MNMTGTQASAGTYLTVFPSGESPPLASNINLGPGRDVANLVTVKVGSDGDVMVYNANGQAHVILDVVGWYGGTLGGSLFNGLSPTRILDTRTSPPGAPPGPVGPNTEITAVVAGGSAVPSGASSVIVNATVTQGTAPSYLTVYPAGLPRPLASNLNFAPSQDIPNLVIVKVGSGGNAKIYNNNGQVHVILDAVGYFGP